MTLYKITGTLAAIAYIAFFTADIVINSGPFRDQLNAGTYSVGTLLVVMLIYAPSNVAFLAMLSGLISGCGAPDFSRKIGVPARRMRDFAEKRSTRA